MNCEVCKQEMRKIGPFARAKAEGQASYKWEGSVQYQCTNEDCKGYLKIVTIKE